jgi:hypothetical protein
MMPPALDGAVNSTNASNSTTTAHSNTSMSLVIAHASAGAFDHTFHFLIAAVVVCQTIVLCALFSGFKWPTTLPQQPEQQQEQQEQQPPLQHTSFVPNHFFYFEAELTIKALITQRRRWTNGTLAGHFFLLCELQVILASPYCSSGLKASATLFELVQVAGAVSSLFSIAIYFLAFRAATTFLLSMLFGGVLPTIPVVGEEWAFWASIDVVQFTPVQVSFMISELAELV